MDWHTIISQRNGQTLLVDATLPHTQLGLYVKYTQHTQHISNSTLILFEECRI